MTPVALNHYASQTGFALCGAACVMLAVRLGPRFIAARRAGQWRITFDSADRSTLLAGCVFGIVGIFPLSALLYFAWLLMRRYPAPTQPKRDTTPRPTPSRRAADPAAYDYYRDGRPQGQGWGIHTSPETKPDFGPRDSIGLRSGLSLSPLASTS